MSPEKLEAQAPPASERRELIERLMDQAHLMQRDGFVKLRDTARQAADALLSAEAQITALQVERDKARELEGELLEALKTVRLAFTLAHLAQDVDPAGSESLRQAAAAIAKAKGLTP